MRSKTYVVVLLALLLVVSLAGIFERMTYTNVNASTEPYTPVPTSKSVDTPIPTITITATVTPKPTATEIIPTETPLPTPTLPPIKLGDLRNIPLEIKAEVAWIEPQIKMVLLTNAGLGPEASSNQPSFLQDVLTKAVNIPSEVGDVGYPCTNGDSAQLTGYSFSSTHHAIDIACPIKYLDKAKTQRIFSVGAATKCTVTSIVVLSGGYSVQCKAGKYTFGTLHLDKEGIAVKAGDQLEKGQFIGTISERRVENGVTMGTTGITTGPHIHFYIVDDQGNYYNPWDFLK